ncbi:MAG TPA: NADH-quinone oxidoreductase subunit L [Bryobacteraceae bacterium]|nr:NADH-quinone oxidoreductase subunit L [Bryobacteraceae bacterium]
MLLWLIPILPFCGFLINGLLGRRMPKALVNVFAVGTVALSFAWVLKTVMQLGPIEKAYVEHYYTWIQSGALNIGLDFAVDRLSAVMLLIVTGVGLLIHIYATGYMAHEGGYYRFFAYMNLFMFFMLILVLAGNYLVLFVGWEGVGLCSYLLIGFYFLEKFATDAGNKAFIVNRIGDFGFSLALFFIVRQFGSLDFGTVFAKAQGMPTEASAGLITGICLLLLVGATGKSAQIPLFVWLPDAMAGPTPVSALIHAATMVTAGVYMTARSAPLYLHAPLAMEAVAIIGIATAFLAATIGLAQNDIKKVFAYSTVSQLGYMFVGVGTGAFGAGIFHLMTHAFFKALLFLGAGSVIHALSGEQDLRNMGGLRTKIPITFWTLLCASLAIAGVPFTSGFFSKDEILVSAYHYQPWIYWVGVVTAGMTAFYVFRAMFLAFFGKYRGHAHPHESPLSMTGPLMILALLSLGGGFINVPHWLEPMFPAAAEASGESWPMYVASFAGLFGIFMAWLFYVAQPKLADQFAGAMGILYKAVYNKYFVDEIYDATVVEPLVQGSRTVLWRGMDAGVIDGLVNAIGARSRGVGGILRRLQAGNVRGYAAWVVFGCVLLLIVIGLGTGGAK